MKKATKVFLVLGLVLSLILGAYLASYFVQTAKEHARVAALAQQKQLLLSEKTKLQQQFAKSQYSPPQTEPGADDADDSGPKLVSIIGDSISSYPGTAPEGAAYVSYYNGSNCGVHSVEDMWWMRLIRAKNWELCVNNSVSGSCCSTGARQDRLSACLPQRTGALADPMGTPPDIILIFIGTNDYYHCVLPGEWDGVSELPTDTTSFVVGYATMLRDVKANYPNAKIYCCTLPYSVNRPADRPQVDSNSDGITRAQWNALIRHTAQQFACSVIDLDDGGFNESNIYQLTGDGRGLHPTAAGHEVLFEAALKFFG